MIMEIGSSVVMAGIAGFAYLKSSGKVVTNDTEKIQKIFTNAGWVKEDREIRIHRKTKIEGGMEYIFQIPLGFDRKKIETHKHVLEDGLNVRHKYFEFDPMDVLKVKWNRNALKEIKKILTSKKITRKEIDIDFDGMLKIRVYTKPMENKIDWDPSILKTGTWSVPIGSTRDGKTIYHDFDESKHLIIAGATGYGKSVLLKLIVTTLILQKFDDVVLSLIDLKGGSAFYRFKDCKQVENLERDPKKAVSILKKIKEEMDAEEIAIVDQGFEDAKEAGIKKRHFVIIDESADLSDYPEAMEMLTEISRKGRSTGHFLILCTQYPLAAVIPTSIKRNIIARVCYLVDGPVASNVVLDETGAELLPDVPGRGIYKQNVKRHIIQTPFMSNEEIERRIQPHVTIKPRKDDDDEQKRHETTANRKHSIVITKV